MFNPSRDQARQFFIDAWRKHVGREVLTPLETIAADLIALHPEYHKLLESGEKALSKDFAPDSGQLNPFLHLGLHLAIEEQLSIDQPNGLRAAYESQLRRLSDRHQALHVVLECLGETIWKAQRHSTPLDGVAYVECVRCATGR